LLLLLFLFDFRIAAAAAAVVVVGSHYKINGFSLWVFSFYDVAWWCWAHSRIALHHLNGLHETSGSANVWSRAGLFRTVLEPFSIIDTESANRMAFAFQSADCRLEKYRDPKLPSCLSGY